jgi:hypothetical protein
VNLRRSNTQPVVWLNLEVRGDAALLADKLAEIRALLAPYAARVRFFGSEIPPPEAPDKKAAPPVGARHLDSGPVRETRQAASCARLRRT